MNRQNNPLVQLALVLLATTITVGGGMFFFRRYTDTNSVIEKLQSENAVLDNRIQILSSSSEDLDTYVDTAYRSVPESNAGLLAVNTIKALGGSEDVFIDGVYVKSSLIEEGIQQVSDVGFEVEGEIGQVFNFLSKLSNSLPILKLLELETNITDTNLATSTINVQAYSQTLPDKLPSLTEALPTLSEEEKSLLSEIENYEYPALSAVNDSSAEESESTFGRENPFSAVTSNQATIEE
jgi:hypothetical protein